MEKIGLLLTTITNIMPKFPNIDKQSKVFDLAAGLSIYPTNANAYGGVTKQQKLFELRIVYRSSASFGRNS